MASSPSTFPFLFPPTRPAYTPDTGFFPAPDPSPSTAPSIFSTTTAPCTLTSSCVRLSPPLPAETPVTAPTCRPAKVHRAHIPSRSSSSTTPNREYQTPQSHASYTPSDPIPTYTPHTYRSSSKTSRRRPPSTLHPSPRSEASSLLEIPVETPLFALPVVGGPVLTEMEPVLYASTTQRNKQNTSTAASMPRSFSGTTSGSSASSDVPAPTPLFGFTSSSVSAATSTTSSQCSSAPSISPSPATSSVAQQMFGEMPTPRLEYENYSSGNPNKIQSSCVQGGSNNPYEHDLDGQPHHYGFDNLKRQTVIRADGTEHSFYGLPENYLLDRATLGPLFDAYDDDMDGCSTELVDVFLGTPEQQKSDQFANCFCEALNAFSKDTPERVSHAYDVNTKGCTDESVHVFINPPEQQPYEGERQESGQLPKCFSKASEIVLPFQHPPMSATATDQMHQMQFQASKSMLNYDVYEKEDSTCINIISGVRDFTIELQQQNDERACHCPVMKASDSLVTRSSQLSVDHSMSKLRMLWDPGDTNFLQSLCATTAVQMTDYMQYIASNGINHVRHATVFIMQRAAHVSQEVHIQQLRDPSFKVLVTHECRKEWDLGDNRILSSALNRGILVVPQTSMLTTSGIFTLPYVLTMRVQFGVFTCVPKQSCYCTVLASHEKHEVQFLWDPGILNQMDTRLEETAVANPVHSMQTLWKLLFFIEQPVGLKFWTQLCHSWCTTPVFLQELHVPMIKTNNCSSTSIGVASSEYTYILMFLHDQWKFVRRGVHETDRAKHLLLSSPIYLQNREMNIFFITFLPP